MQAVDILRYNRLELACFFQLCEFQMRGVRLNAFDDEFFAIEAIELGGIIAEEVRAQNLFGRIIPFLMIQSIDTAEVGDSTFGRHASPTEKHNRR